MQITASKGRFQGHWQAMYLTMSIPLIIWVSAKLLTKPVWKKQLSTICIVAHGHIGIRISLRSTEIKSLVDQRKHRLDTNWSSKLLLSKLLSRFLHRWFNQRLRAGSATSLDVTQSSCHEKMSLKLLLLTTRWWEGKKTWQPTFVVDLR